MPPKVKVTKEAIVEKAYIIIRDESIEQLNARHLAEMLNCSTQPIFKNFKNMDELKQAVKEKIDIQYDEFINANDDKEDSLFAVSTAYINFARKETYLFGALFVHPLVGCRTLPEVLASPWNADTLSAISRQYSLSQKQAEALYRDVRFYCHGIGAQLYAGTIILTKKEIENLVRNAIDRFR